MPLSGLLQVGASLHPALKNRFLARLLWLFFRKNGSKTPIVTNLGMDRDLKVYFPPEDVRPVLAFGTPRHYLNERGALFLARELFSSCDGFLDVGSHYGYFVFFLRTREKEKPIYFFEPNSKLFTLLKNSVEKNNLKNVFGFQKAISGKDGTATFFECLNDNSMSSLSKSSLEDAALSPTTVETLTLDSFLNSKSNLKNLLVKVDIENCEFEFLEGVKNSLPRIRHLIIEVLLEAVNKGFIREMIEKHKFNAYYINDFQLCHSPTGEFSYQQGQINWLFCRETPLELKTLLKHSQFKVL